MGGPSPSKGGLRSRLIRLDLHPKLETDFVVRSKQGAVASIVAVILSATLFWGELRAYLALEKAEFMEVDPLRGDIMRINFDITFPSMSCSGEAGGWRRRRRQCPCVIHLLRRASASINLTPPLPLSLVTRCHGC